VRAPVHDPEDIFEDAGHTAEKRALQYAPWVRAGVSGASRCDQSPVLSLPLHVLKALPRYIFVPGPHLNLLVTSIASSPVIITDVRAERVMAILTGNV
jgi:hypothetical protein